MTYSVEITEIRSLDDFKNLIRPVAEAEYDRVASLPQEVGRIRINVDPETTVAIATDEFTRLLPKAYLRRSGVQKNAHSGRPSLVLRNTVPVDVVIGTIRKMTTLKTP